MNTFGNQATNKLWSCGPIRGLGGSLDLVGQMLRIIVSAAVVKCPKSLACIGGNIDKADLLTGASALTILFELVGQPKLSGR